MLNLSGTVKAIQGKTEVRITLVSGSWHLRISTYQTNHQLYSANSFTTMDEATAAAEKWLAEQPGKGIPDDRRKDG